MTSMQKVSDSSSNWLGDLAAAFLPPSESGQSGDCLGMSAIGLTGISCDMVSNFVCQAPDPPDVKPFPSIRLFERIALLQNFNQNLNENSDIFKDFLPIDEGKFFSGHR